MSCTHIKRNQSGTAVLPVSHDFISLLPPLSLLPPVPLVPPIPRPRSRPIRRMIALLKSNWRPDRVHETKNAALGIISGQYGARLTHDHRTQFYYVLQSLQLWLEVRIAFWSGGRGGERVVGVLMICVSWSRDDLLAINSRSISHEQCTAFVGVEFRNVLSSHGNRFQLRRY